MVSLRSAVVLVVASTLFALFSCGTGGSGGNSGDSGKTLQSVSVSPMVTVPIPVGLTQQLAASAYYSDGTGEDVSEGVMWASDNESIATVDSNGLVTAVGAGEVTITASFSGTMSSGTTVTVSTATLQSISLGIGNLSLASGLSLPITVTGHYSDGSTGILTGASFAVGDGEEATASVSGLGVVTGLASGDVTVTATYGSFSDSIDLTVTSAALSGISIQVGSISLAAGLTTPIQVIAQFTDGSSALLTDGYTVNVSGTGSLVGGVLSALMSGTATVSASYGDFDATPVDVTVTAAVLDSISLELDAGTLPLGLTTHVRAFGHYSDASVVELTSGVTLGSSNTAKVTVNASGLVSAVSAGGANITASFGGKNASLPITISSAVLQSISLAPSADLTLGLPLGLTAQLVVTGHYSDSSTAVIGTGVSFSSLTPALASVSGGGLISALTTGSASIKASYPGVADATFGLTTTSPELVSITAVPGTTALALIGGVLTTTVTVTATYSDASTMVIPNS
ncbi:MAG TPA: Ig-like domain-containing protein, partial [bacterium]